MKNVYISYNPYKLETIITINNEELKQNSKIREKCKDGTRLQDWIEELPHLLCEEFADREFDITFHGILQDYDDVGEVFGNAAKRGIIRCAVRHIPPKQGTENKDQLIRSLYNKIQRGPIEALRSHEIADAFAEQQSRDFSICVIATMSAGKSTLINAMLRTKLMPSRGDATTAIITKVKDVTDDENAPWRAEIFGTDENQRRIKSYDRITLEDMIELNDNHVVSRVEIEGNIPFVSSKDMSLILVDTPGAGMAHDDSHKRVQEEYLNKTAKELILFVLPPTFEATDVANLLKLISDIMKVGGKQSKDRFLFVVNKMDDHKSEDGPVEVTLDKVRAVLQKYGIENPNLYPIAALPALRIRSVLKGADDSENVREAGCAVEKLMSDKMYYFEEYASLPTSLQEMIKSQSEQAAPVFVDPTEINRKAQAACNTPMLADMYKNKYELTLNYGNAALIHTGVPSLEAAIRQYVEKYAKTAKIHTFADAIKKKLEQTKYSEELKHAISTNTQNANEIRKQIAETQRQLEKLQDAKAFQREINAAIEAIKEQSRQKSEEILRSYQRKLSQVIERCTGKVPIDDIDDILRDLKDTADTLEPAFRAELSQVVQDALESTSRMLINQYRTKLKGINTGSGMFSGFNVRMIETLAFDVPSPEALVENYTKTERVSDGREWIKNADKRWYKPWTWFQESGYWREKYRDETYIDGASLCDEIVSPIQNSLWDNCNRVQEQAIAQANALAERFKAEMARIGELMKKKLSDLDRYTADRSNAEEKVRKSKELLQWLEQMLKELDTILDI